MADTIEIGIRVQIGEGDPLNLTLTQARNLHAALSQLLGPSGPINRMADEKEGLGQHQRGIDKAAPLAPPGQMPPPSPWIVTC